MTRSIADLRVSARRQGASGLRIEGGAQRDAIAPHLAGLGGAVPAEFVEVEGGRKHARPQLAAALAARRRDRAALLAAKVDRLGRSAGFLLRVAEGTGGCGVVFCDLPAIPLEPVGEFLLTQMAAVAELEAGPTPRRARAALAPWKERNPGKRLGNPRRLAGTPEQARAAAAAKAAQADRQDGMSASSGSRRRDLNRTSA